MDRLLVMVQELKGFQITVVSACPSLLFLISQAKLPEEPYVGLDCAMSSAVETRSQGLFEQWTLKSSLGVTDLWLKFGEHREPINTISARTVNGAAKYGRKLYIHLTELAASVIRFQQLRHNPRATPTPKLKSARSAMKFPLASLLSLAPLLLALTSAMPTPQDDVANSDGSVSQDAPSAENVPVFQDAPAPEEGSAPAHGSAPPDESAPQEESAPDGESPPQDESSSQGDAPQDDSQRQWDVSV